MVLSSNVQWDSKGKPLRFFSLFPNPGLSDTNLLAQVLDPSENAYVFLPFFGRVFYVIKAMPLYFCYAYLSPKRYRRSIPYHRTSSGFQVGSKSQ